MNELVARLLQRKELHCQRTSQLRLSTDTMLYRAMGCAGVQFHGPASHEARRTSAASLRWKSTMRSFLLAPPPLCRMVMRPYALRPPMRDVPYVHTETDWLLTICAQQHGSPAVKGVHLGWSSWSRCFQRVALHLLLCIPKA